MKKVYIVDGKRTPIGSIMGSLSSVSGPELCGCAIKALLNETRIDPQLVNSVIIGNVLSSGIGQNPARQASLLGGLAISTPCTNVNKVCASGMKAVMIGALEIMSGVANVVIAGGFESMSNAPHLIKRSRKGIKFGNFEANDSIIIDGLTDAYSNITMGYCAEKTAKQYPINREIQDDFTISSYEKSLTAIKLGHFKWEICPVVVPDKGIISSDEEPIKFTKEKISTAKLAFVDAQKNGTITPANASKLNDGGCVLMLMSEKAIIESGLNPLAEIISFADAEIQPIDFNLAPPIAVKKALQKCNLDIEDIDYWEINEAFSLTPLVFMKELNISREKVNLNGGAVSLGHPLGMSGARIILSLINILKINNGKTGCAAICNGGGGASAIVLKKIGN